MMNDITTIKKEVQKKALKSWAESNFKGTLQIATGVGKTRIGVIAACEFIRRNPSEKSLIVVPKEQLRDIEWEKEIEKWGYSEYRDNITIECINTSYRRSGEYFNTLVVDEIHTALSPQFRKLFENNSFDRILGLSATVDDAEKITVLRQHGIDIIFRYNLNDAEKDGIISPYYAFNLAAYLTKDEMDLYMIYSSDMKESAKIFAAPGDNPLAAAMQLIKNPSANPAIRKYAFAYQKALSERKKLLYHLRSKYENTIELIKKYYNNNKIIVFSEDISFVDNINNYFLKNTDIKCSIYHSKLKAKEKELNIKNFREGNTNVLLSVKALNAGFNVPEANIGISASGNSTDLDDTQRRGRILRPEDGKVGLYINLYGPSTVEENWVKDRTQQKKISYVSTIDEIELTICL